MHSRELIQNRKSVRAFADKPVFFGELDKVREYYNHSVRRLIPQIKTELRFFGADIQKELEGAAGYNQFLVGAPQYLVLLSEKHPLSCVNAGYMMQDMLLKLSDMDLDSCWLTFADSNDIKGVLGIAADMEVAAIAAFGYGKKTVRRLRLNLRSMSDVDVVAKHRYMEPKRSVQDLAYVETWANRYNLERYIGFYDDMLWEAFYAASLAPSYLNRQAYGFLLKPGSVTLVSKPDAYNTNIDRDLSLGIVLHHFTVTAENWAGKLIWRYGKVTADLELPEGYEIVATCAL